MAEERPEPGKRFLTFAKSRNGIILFLLCIAAIAFVIGNPGKEPGVRGGGPHDESVTLEELAAVMPELREARESVLISRNPLRLQGVETTDLTLRGLVLKDAAIKGGSMKGCSLPGLHAENVVFEDFVFDTVTIENGAFINVRFVNCIVTGSRFQGGGRDAVIFEGCRFQGGENNSLVSRGAVTLRSCVLEPGFRLEGDPALTLEDTVLP